MITVTEFVDGLNSEYGGEPVVVNEGGVEHLMGEMAFLRSEYDRLRHELVQVIAAAEKALQPVRVDGRWPVRGARR